jgi:Dolichyl-phosphate-mannose-protein mannosyltransferase
MPPGAEGIGCALISWSRRFAMAGRRSLHAVVLFAVILHAIAISQTLLPAQDGLKFIRIARDFQTHPWDDVIRGADAHPLYPALIAVAEPVVAWFTSPGPAAWRTAAQIVAVIASVGLILPIYGLTLMLFDRRIACMAAALAVLLPRAAELGHDTLSDSLGLMCTFLALWLGARALRRGDWRIAAASGLVAGAGYLARPEVILVPCAIALAWLVGFLREPRPRKMTHLPALLTSLVCAFAVVGSYAAVKGEVSEKLAVRLTALLGPRHEKSRRLPQQLPRGLDDPRWDFSPKEEGERIPIHGAGNAVGRIVGKWWEELCWLFAVMTVWGLARQRFIRGICPDRNPHDSSAIERRLLLIFAVAYVVALVRHSVLLGYLSGRHIMPLVVVSLPWAAAGSFVCARGLAVKLRWNESARRKAAALAGCATIAASIVVQMQPSHLNHLSRSGHWAAGRWLAQHAGSSELVLDTRGWAKFISGQPGYDYWHVRQALGDSHLAYIVVGLDELHAHSTRAKTLSSLLAFSATPVVDFPAFPGDPAPAVRIYRYHRPRTWEGLSP